MKFRLIVHPFIFSTYAILALLASNTMINHLSGFRSLLVTMIGAMVLFLLLRFLLQDVIKASLITSGFILLWFSYGHINTLLNSLVKSEGITTYEVILLLIWILLFIGCVFMVLKMKPNISEQVSRYLNWTSLLLILFPIYTLTVYSNNASKISPMIDEYISVSWNIGGVSSYNTIQVPNYEGPRPDIYYIILDAYTRSDVLEELYSYDNSSFIQFLEDREFHVIVDGRANYTDTEYSIASSLNLMHINTIPEFFRKKTDQKGEWIVKQVAGKLIQGNHAGEFLREHGYTFVAYDSGYDPTRIRDADLYIYSPELTGMSTKQIIFEMMLFDTSLGRVYTRLRGKDFTPLQNLFNAHRDRVVFTLQDLPKFAELDGDYFIFAHILSPHPPFVFGPNGEEIKGNDPYTLLDAHHGKEEHIELYSNQVNYLNTLIMETIDQIISKSYTPPIIILQSDHGSRVYNESDPPDDIKLKLLVPILNAYYLPGVETNVIYPSITPVNTFRMVFNEYFGADYELLEDNTYLLDIENGQQGFINVCEENYICNVE